MTILWYQYFQLLGLLIAILFYKDLSRNNIAFFILFILVENITEFIGVNFRNFGWDDNYFVYNIYLLVSTPVMLYLYNKMLILNSKMKQVFVLISVLIMMLIFINYFFLQGVKKFNTHSLIVIELLNIVLSCIVLFQLVFKDDIERSLFKEPFFWINSGVLFFSLGTIVILGLQQYIRTNNIELNQKIIYFIIMPLLNVILYTFWAYAFILCRAKSS